MLLQPAHPALVKTQHLTILPACMLMARPGCHFIPRGLKQSDRDCISKFLQALERVHQPLSCLEQKCWREMNSINVPWCVAGVVAEEFSAEVRVRIHNT